MNCTLKKMSFSLCLLFSVTANAFLAQHIPHITVDKKKIAIATVTLAALTGAYYKYGDAIVKKVKHYKNSLTGTIQNSIEEKIENEMVDSVIVATTPNILIITLPAKEKEKKLRKKAQLINTRIRVLEKLEAQLASSSLSRAHQEKLRKKYNNITAVFNSIDRWRKSLLCIQNPYEQEYKNPSIKDTIVETQIIKSLVLSTKPKNECSNYEKSEKIKIKQRRARILQKITARLSHKALVSMIRANPAMIDLVAA